MYALYYTVLYTGKLGFRERERKRALGVIIASVPVLPPSPQCANNDFANFLPPFLWKIFCLPLFGEVGWVRQCNLGHVSGGGMEGAVFCLFVSERCSSSSSSSAFSGGGKEEKGRVRCFARGSQRIPFRSPWKKCQIKIFEFFYQGHSSNFP